MNEHAYGYPACKCPVCLRENGIAWQRKCATDAKHSYIGGASIAVMGATLWFFACAHMAGSFLMGCGACMAFMGHMLGRLGKKYLDVVTSLDATVTQVPSDHPSRRSVSP